MCGENEAIKRKREKERKKGALLRAEEEERDGHTDTQVVDERKFGNSTEKLDTTRTETKPGETEREGGLTVGVSRADVSTSSRLPPLLGIKAGATKAAASVAASIVITSSLNALIRHTNTPEQEEGPDAHTAQRSR